MTTEAASNHYLARHLHEVESAKPAIYNPHQKPLDQLKVIYGFNNGGSPGWWNAVAITEDGLVVAGHLCSHEGYMPNDLGILEGSRPDRHEHYREIYPEGYRMEFVPSEDLKSHDGFKEAIEKNQFLAENHED